MRKFFAGVALLCVVIGSSACEAKDSSGSDDSVVTATSSPVVKRARTGSNTASCSAKFDRYAELSKESAALIGTMDLTSRSNLRAILELTDSAVDTGRFLVRTCDAPAGFASSVDDLADAADELRGALY